MHVPTLGAHALLIECGGGGDCGPLSLQFLCTGSARGANTAVRPLLQKMASRAMALGFVDPSACELGSPGAWAHAELLCMAAWALGLALTVHIAPRAPGSGWRAVQVCRKAAGVPTTANATRPVHMVLLPNDHYQAMLPVQIFD